MMENAEYNKIDDYLMGRLQGAALEAFEQRLKEDKDLAEKVQAQQQALGILRQAGDLNLKREIQEVEDSFFRQKRQPALSRRLSTWIIAAASLLLLFFAYRAWQKSTPNQLYDEYYLAYNTSIGDRDAVDEAIRIAKTFDK